MPRPWSVLARVEVIWVSPKEGRRTSPGSRPSLEKQLTNQIVSRIPPSPKEIKVVKSLKRKRKKTENYLYIPAKRRNS